MSSEAITFTNWSDMDYPYQNHKGLKNYDNITVEEINYLIKQPCLFGRKFNPKCKVIESLTAYARIQKSVSLTLYLTKELCD